eukprot:1209797-Rhodomonas_salina.3
MMCGWLQTSGGLGTTAHEPRAPASPTVSPSLVRCACFSRPCCSQSTHASMMALLSHSVPTSV